VVVDGRVFARSWMQRENGWYRTFLHDPFGTIQVGDRQVGVRAVRVRSTRIRDEIERAYAKKYQTPASLKYVRGFRTERRRDTTVEFVPRQPEFGRRLPAVLTNDALRNRASRRDRRV
jgi:hypothetical protein